MKKQSTVQLTAAVLLILGAAMLRLPRFIPNFSPVAAMALFGGAVLQDRKLAYIIPLGALLLSDICFQLFTSVPGFYSWGQLVNYGAFALITFTGTHLRRLKAGNIIFASLLASVIFYVLSNFGGWVFGDNGLLLYPHTASGLLACYIAAIPFFGNTILGDLFYSGVLFGAYHIITHFVARQRAVA